MAEVPQPQQVPLQEADLVMQGGVTSGLVFPELIRELSRDFQFKRIGGTSAGAIAAVLAAAAEAKRQLLGTPGTAEQPFEELAHLGRTLAGPLDPRDPQGTRLLEGLFAPNVGLQPLFQVLRGSLDRQGTQGKALAMVRALLDLVVQQEGAAQARRLLARSGLLPYLQVALQRLAAQGHAVGLALHPWLGERPPELPLRQPWLLRAPLLTVILLLAGGLGVQWTLIHLLMWLWPGSWPMGDGPVLLGSLLTLGLVLGTGWWALRRLQQALRGVPDALQQAIQGTVNTNLQLLNDNHFGFSTAFEPTEQGGGATRFTPWLHRQLQRILPQYRVLTFGQLQEAGVELRLITSCLSQQRPYVLPMTEERRKDFYFKVEEWQHYFPPEVLDHLVKHADRVYMDEREPAPPGRTGWRYYRLPPQQDLPVLVATRLSMSFPVLFSAVPLWVIQDMQADRRFPQRVTLKYPVNQSAQPQAAVFHRARVQKVMFSDGGLTSDFPMMLFDEVIPERVSLAVNLQYRDRDAPAFLSRMDSPGAVWAPYNTPVRNMVELGLSAFDTSRNWFDQSFLTLPGYPERSVSITIASGQGGLNLGMQASTIDTLLQKGAEAGEVLRRRFGRLTGKEAWNQEQLLAYAWRNISADLGELLVRYSDTFLLNGAAKKDVLGHMPLNRDGGPHMPNIGTLTNAEKAALAALYGAAQEIKRARGQQVDYEKALFPSTADDEAALSRITRRGRRGRLRYRPLL